MIRAARQTHAVTYATAQEYLDCHAVRGIRGGNEFETVVARDVVVKTVSLDKLMRGEVMRLQWGSKRLLRPGELVAQAQPTVDELLKVKLGMQDDLKAKLGSLVVPFELHSSLRLHQQRAWGLFGEGWTEPESVYNAYVQRRVAPRDLLTAEIARRRDAGDIDGMGQVLDGVLASFAGLVRHGYLPHDWQPGNFVWLDGAVRLLDLGAVWKVGKRVQGTLNGTGRDDYVERNLMPWHAAIVGKRGSGVSESRMRCYERFADKIDRFYTWSSVHGREVKGRGVRAGNGAAGHFRVPDLFPLTLEVESMPTPIMQRRLAGLRHGANPWDPERYLPSWLKLRR